MFDSRADGREISDGFPSAYKFESDEEKAAKARRLERFNNPAPVSNGAPVAIAVPYGGVEGSGGGLGARMGLQVGKSRFSNYGYEPEVAEVDPVSALASVRCKLTAERDGLGPSHDPRHVDAPREVLLASNICAYPFPFP